MSKFDIKAKPLTTADINGIAQNYGIETDADFQEIESLVFVPNATNKPEYTPGLLSLKDARSQKGINILTKGNTCAIIGYIGSAKTSSIEAIIVSFLSNTADCLGFSGKTECLTILLVSTELSNYDSWQEYDRIKRRAGIDSAAEPDKLYFFSITGIPEIEKRKKFLYHKIETLKPDVLILDLISDFVLDVNDAVESIGFLNEILAKIHNLNIGLICSLHSNPGKDVTKPRGHLGSELIRRAESVLYIKKDTQTGIRTLTTNFEHGKNRNNSDDIASYFIWSDDKMMFVSCDFTPVNKTQSRMKLEKLARRIFKDFTSMTAGELITAIAEDLDVSESTAKRKKNDMQNETIVNKHEGRFYCTLPNENEKENEDETESF